MVVHCSSDPIDLQSHKLVRGHANSPYIHQGSDTIFSMPPQIHCRNLLFYFITAKMYSKCSTMLENNNLTLTKSIELLATVTTTRAIYYS